jgi:LysM repeat protein
MKGSKRLFYYLFLNILVSACTTFAVLAIWDSTQGPTPGGLLPIAIGSIFSNETPTPAVMAVAETPAPPLATATPAVYIYTVRDGDTFASIAEQFEIPVQQLLEFNGFTNPNVLGVGEVLQIPLATPAPSPAPATTTVAIESVIGVGDLASERILIKHTGEGEISLAGWKLRDGDGHEFIFPELTLFKDGAINIQTRVGNNTVVDLFWGLDQSILQSGENVELLDAAGVSVSTYQVP